METPSRSSHARPSLDRVVPILLLLGALAYAVFLFRAGSGIAGGSDSSGYLNSARLFSEGKLFGEIRLPEGATPAGFGIETFQPLGFVVDPHAARLVPTYPPGLSLHLAAAAALVGWDQAAPLVNVFSALGSGALLWLLARRLAFSPGWSAAAVTWLWLSPVFLYAVLLPMSDAPATLWTLATLYAALRAGEGPRWSVACGAAIACAVLVRPTNLLLVFPVLFALGFRPRRLLWFGLGGAPGAILLGWYNFKLHGRVVATGYGDVSEHFGFRFVLDNLGRVGPSLVLTLSPFIVAAVIPLFLPRRWHREGLILAGWAILLGLFYLFYLHTGEAWWYLRFLLPIYPLLILGALAAGRLRPFPGAVPVALLAGVVFCELRADRQLRPGSIADDERPYQASAVWTRTHLPANSAVFCMQVSGAFYFYTDFIVINWSQLEPKQVGPLLELLQRQHRPIYAVLYPFESSEARAKLGGSWTEIAPFGLASVWKREN